MSLKQQDCAWTPVHDALKGLLQRPDYQDARRIFHGRSGRIPELGWCNIDAFWPIILITAYQEPPPGFLTGMAKLLAEIPSIANEDSSVRLAIQRRDLPSAPTTFIVGEPTPQAVARRGQQCFDIAFDRQNIGFFTDIEPARQWLEREAQGRRVLNLFAFTCVFSVIALQAGAESVVNIDLSRSALERGRQNHHLNGLHNATARFEALDILKSWGRIKKRGPFDIILIDPPSYQRGSFIASRDYSKIIRRIPELAAPGGQVLSCLNAPEIADEFLRQEFRQRCPEARLVTALQQDSVFLAADGQQPLKMLVWQWNPKSRADSRAA